MKQIDQAIKFVNGVKAEAKKRGRPRTSLPKAPASSDPVTAALSPLGLADKVNEAPKGVAAFIKAFKAGKYPELVSS